jgi:hypothetical protein
MVEKPTPDTSLDDLKHLLAGETGDGRLLADNLENNPICTVSYDSNVPCLLVRWKCYTTSTQIRYIHECLIRLIKRHGVSKILGDDTDLVCIGAADQHWITGDWMPRAFSAGLRAAASIKPRAYFAQVSVEHILSFVPVGLVIRSFDSHQNARQWLRSVYQPGTYRILYRRFKGGDPINSYSFWCDDPHRGYFKQLAQVALRAFWKLENGVLGPYIPRQPLPELIVIETELGVEICRWSLEDEIRQLDHHS